MVRKVLSKRISAWLAVAAVFALFVPTPFTAVQFAAAQEASSSRPTLDFEFFKTRVEPIFLKRRSPDHARCYSCHEKRKHHTGLNLEPLSPGATVWNDEQSRLNFQTVSKLVVPGNPTASMFVMHPLAPEAGGDIRGHNGGRQFGSQNDPDWQNMEKWAKGEKAQ